MRYRPDVDGLRAVAVVPVVLYHFGFRAFSGGFVGVDIFFVISGFLITALISDEIGKGRFSLLSFYERRIRRIFPALIVLIAVVSVLASLELFPRAFGRFGGSVAATSLFVSNVDFWLGTGYFAADADSKPLLHTWSLAVEEQFYFFFPLLMMLIARYAKGWGVIILATLCGASLVLSAWAVSAKPDAAFFLLPFRAWELGIGALIALDAARFDPGATGRDVLSGIGIAMIGYSVVGYSSGTPFPGIAALVPCLGAGLVIHSGLWSGPMINRLLSTWPVVSVGKLSYSLYLWHWPIYVLAKYYVGRELSSVEVAGLLVASLAAATISWRYVEQPFRHPQGIVSRPLLFFQAAAAMSLLGVFGTVVSHAQGLPQRFPQDIQTILASDGEALSCRPRAINSASMPCKIGQSAAKPTFMLWGDSHGRAILPALVKAADRNSASGVAIVGNGCAPLLGSKRMDGFAKYCRDRHDIVRDFLDDHPDITTVILAARWALEADGTPYGNEGAKPIFYQDDESRELSLTENRRVFERSFRRTIEYLHRSGRRIILIGPVPEIGWNVPQTLARRRMRNLSADFGPTLNEFQKRNKFVFSEFDKQEAPENFEIVYPHRILCPASRCAVEHQGKPLYLDDDHLSHFGAEEISQLFDPIFATIERQAHAAE